MEGDFILTLFTRKNISKSLLISSAIISAPFVATISQVEASSLTYNDFNSNAYWASDMQWMIDNGYITGYINQKHPSTGKWGTWLDPNGKLTEYQMLSVMLRYELGVDTYKSLKSQGNNEIGWHYVKAKELGVVTKGSTANTKPANVQVTRGQLAQALVSLHYGKSVTLNDAIEFMYANKITTGTNPNAGQTVANFGPNDKLSRAQISAFLSRYHTAEYHGIVDTINSKPVDTVKPTEPTKPSNPDTIKPGESVTTASQLNALTKFTQKKGTADVTGSKIKTKYGERTYGARSQAEYDQIMKFVDNIKLSDFGTAVLRSSSAGEVSKELFDAYKAGERPITDKKNPMFRSPKNTILKGIDFAHTSGIIPINSIADLEMFSNISNLAQLGTEYGKTNIGSSNLEGTKGVSAYELFYEGGDNCLTWSYAKQAMFDRMGVDSVVVHSPSQMHAYTAVYLNGKWFNFDGTLGALELLPGDYISHAPNGGVDILTKEMKDIYKPKN